MTAQAASARHPRWKGKLLEVARQHGLDLLPWDGDALALQARILSLRHWRPRDGWPDVSDLTLLATAGSWLTPHLDRPDLDDLDLHQILMDFLDAGQRASLERLAPLRIKTPAGYRRLRYQPGHPPVLAVLVQELYGITTAPTVCDGEVPVLLHLLTPAQTVLAVTADLARFWTTTYKAQRAELLHRYPRHYWPPRPWAAQPQVRPYRKRLSGPV